MKKIYLIMITVFMISFIVQGASKIPILNEKSIKLSQEEIKFIKELNKKGRVKIATTYQENTYYIDSDGKIKGFHYKLANDFASKIGVKLDIKIVDEWSKYFIKKGEDIERVKTDEKYSYTPDLFNEVEIYVAGITALSWREKLFDIVKFIPNKQMVVCRRDENIKKIGDLNNKSAVFVKNSSFENNFLKLLTKNKLNTKIIYEEDFVKTSVMVSEGKDIFTIHDSDNAFKAVAEYKNLTIAFPISDFEMIGWGVSKNNRILTSILTKYIKYARDNGTIDKYWKETFGVTFSEYMRVLEYR